MISVKPWTSGRTNHRNSSRTFLVSLVPIVLSIRFFVEGTDTTVWSRMEACPVLTQMVLRAWPHQIPGMDQMMKSMETALLHFSDLDAAVEAGSACNAVVPTVLRTLMIENVAHVPGLRRFKTPRDPLGWNMTTPPLIPMNSSTIVPSPHSQQNHHNYNHEDWIEETPQPLNMNLYWILLFIYFYFLFCLVFFMIELAKA